MVNMIKNFFTVFNLIAIPKLKQNKFKYNEESMLDSVWI